MFFKIFYVVAFVKLYKDMYVYVKKYIVGENGKKEKITATVLLKAILTVLYHMVVLTLSHGAIIAH